MIWGAITTNVRSQLIIMNGNLTVQRYIDNLLQPVLALFMQQRKRIKISLFQQDHARTHCKIDTETLIILNMFELSLVDW